MRLQHITFTGIDARTGINDLIDIQREFPIAEFGVLTSYHWYENGNRYLNPAFLSNLYGGNGELKLALHVCGSAAHDAAVGEWQKIEDHLFGTLELFNRIQLNVANRNDNPVYLWAPPYLGQELIVQQNGVEDLSLYAATCDIWNGSRNRVSLLLDASGGRGIDTPLEVYASNNKIGYAGGFNPDNVGDKLSFLMSHVTQGTFWIDMESGVRTDDWFDTDKVRRVLKICNEIINDFEKEE